MVGVVDSGIAFLDTISVADFECNNVCVMDRNHPLETATSIGMDEMGGFSFISLGPDYLGRTPYGRKVHDGLARNVEAETFQSYLACAS